AGRVSFAARAPSATSAAARAMWAGIWPTAGSRSSAWISPGMLGEARRLNPGITFTEADMRALPVADASWAAIVCFYAIVHLPPDDLPAAFTQFRRALRPGGRVVVAFHVGSVVVHRDEWWE